MTHFCWSERGTGKHEKFLGMNERLCGTGLFPEIPPTATSQPELVCGMEICNGCTFGSHHASIHFSA